MNIKEILSFAQERLEKCEFITRSLLESEILLSYTLHKDRIYLHTHFLEEISQDAKQEFFALLDRRSAGEPIEYITHLVSFYSKDFYIDARALIPRSESEILVDEAIQIIESNHISSICEVGIGSGILSIILALRFPDIDILGIDISQDALEVAKINTQRFEIKNIKLQQGDILSKADLKYELIISNPPYIQNSYPISKPLHYEPKNALFGGENGDEILKELIIQSFHHKAKFLICEMGYDQLPSIAKFSKDNCPNTKIKFYKDLAQFDRGFILDYTSSFKIL